MSGEKYSGEPEGKDLTTPQTGGESSREGEANEALYLSGSPNEEDLEHFREALPYDQDRKDNLEKVAKISARKIEAITYLLALRTQSEEFRNLPRGTSTYDLSQNFAGLIDEMYSQFCRSSDGKRRGAIPFSRVQVLNLTDKMGQCLGIFHTKGEYREPEEIEQEKAREQEMIEREKRNRKREKKLSDTGKHAFGILMNSIIVKELKEDPEKIKEMFLDRVDQWQNDPSSAQDTIARAQKVKEPLEFTPGSQYKSKEVTDIIWAQEAWIDAASLFVKGK